MFLVSVKSETLGHVPKGNALYGEVTGRQNILLFYSCMSVYIVFIYN